MLTASRARDLLSYDPETGCLWWKPRAREAFSCDGAFNVHKSHAGKLTAQGVSCGGYRRVAIDGHRYLAHRVIWLMMTGEWPCDLIDHVNLDRSDNAWRNLRLATKQENAQNIAGAHKDSRSGVLGAYMHSSGRWHARIRAYGRTHSLGYFETAADAAEAYARAKATLHTFQPTVRSA